jgi:hypothetical protein
MEKVGEKQKRKRDKRKKGERGNIIYRRREERDAKKERKRDRNT